MDTDLLYLALAEEVLCDCFRPDKTASRAKIRDIDCIDSFKADTKSIFFPRATCSIHRKLDKREPGLFKEELRCTIILCLCSKTYCCYNNKSDKLNFSREKFEQTSSRRIWRWDPVTV